VKFLFVNFSNRLFYCLCCSFCYRKNYSGFPGGVDYAMLALIKDGVMKPKTEKIINARMVSLQQK